MRMYVIVAIRKNSISQYVERVFWGEAESGQAGWTSPPVEASAAEVIGAIERGEHVETALSIDGIEVASRGVRVLIDREGQKFLGSVPTGGCRALALFDLPQF